MQRVFSQVAIAKKRQRNPSDLLQHLSTSLQKHEMEIKRMEKNAPSDVRLKLENDYQRALDYQKMVDQSLSDQQPQSPK